MIAPSRLFDFAAEAPNAVPQESHQGRGGGRDLARATRLAQAAVIVLHAPLIVPGGVRPGTPVQVHVAADDPFAPADQRNAFHASASRADADSSLYTYPGAGHRLTDDELPDYDRGAADEVWRRAGALLAALR